MALSVVVLSKSPPGGRCTLYAGYADVLAARLNAHVRIVPTQRSDAHARGYPTLLIDGVPVKPADGVIVVPADVCVALGGRGCDDETLAALAVALEAPLDRMMDAAG